MPFTPGASEAACPNGTRDLVKQLSAGERSDLVTYLEQKHQMTGDPYTPFLRELPDILELRPGSGRLRLARAGSAHARQLHYIIGAPGWEEVADYAIDWAAEQARLPVQG